MPRAGQSDVTDDSHSSSDPAGCQSSSDDSTSISQSSDLEIPSDLTQDKMGNPTQPKLQFPGRVFGGIVRSFQASWFCSFPWLEYLQERDAAFCYCCRLFNPPTIATHLAFTRVGFRDWKHACGKKGSLTSHNASHAHKDAMLIWQQFKLNTARGTTVGARLDKEGRKIIRNNRHYVKSIAEAILLCAQQGIALRGHEETMEDPSINPGNF